MRRKGHGGVLAALAVGWVLSGSPFACSSPASLAGPGGACSLVTDCQDGLVCCNGSNESNGSKGTLTCVASVGCLEPAGVGGADAGGPPGTGQTDATPGGDARSPPATDAAPPQDTGTLNQPPDAGAVKPPMDSGQRPADTGASEEAAPPPPPDSGASGDAPLD